AGIRGRRVAQRAGVAVAGDRGIRHDGRVAGDGRQRDRLPRFAGAGRDAGDGKRLGTGVLVGLLVGDRVEDGWDVVAEEGCLGVRYVGGVFGVADVVGGDAVEAIRVARLPGERGRGLDRLILPERKRAAVVGDVDVVEGDATPGANATGLAIVGAGPGDGEV